MSTYTYHCGSATVLRALTSPLTITIFFYSLLDEVSITTDRFLGMVPLVRISLALLRLATHAIFFLEAQRLLLRLVRPSGHKQLIRLEDGLLQTVRSRLRHRWLTDANGNTIHVLEFDDGCDQTADDRVAVLLHGHSMSAAFWYRNVDHLVMLGFRVFAVDILGWGQSSRPRFSGSSPDDAVAWYISSLSFILSSTLHLSHITLIGHSLGAYLTMELARFHHQSEHHQLHQSHTGLVIDKMVLIAPAASTSWCSWARALYFKISPQRLLRRCGLLAYLYFLCKYPTAPEYMQHDLRDYTFHLARHDEQNAGGELVVTSMIKLKWSSFWKCHPVCSRPLIDRLHTASLSSAMSSSPSCYKYRLKQVPSLKQVPILVVSGARDSSMPVQSAMQLVSEMQNHSFQVTLKVMDDCDHCPHLEKPTQFLDTIQTFL